LQGLGVAAVDAKLFDVVHAKLKDGHSVDVKRGTKMGRRLLRECGKARMILSANEQTQIVLECFGDEDRDFKFDVTRGELEGAVGDIKAACTKLVAEAIASSAVEDGAASLTAVELIGGGTRIPFVRNAVLDIVGADKLSQTLDSNSTVALGASTLAPGFYARLLAKEADGTPPAEADAKEADGADAPATPAADDAEHAPAAGDAPETETLKGAAGVVGEDTSGAEVVVFLLEDARAGGGDAASTFHAVASTESHVAVEHSMGAQDTLLKQVDSEKDALESYIYETRSASDSSHKALFDEEKTMPLLTEAEDWLFSEEGGDAITAPGPALERLVALKAKVAEINPKYYEAVESDRLAREKELEEERKRAEAEEAAKPKDDHDRRQLKKGDRMKKLVSNKTEGTELFKGGNYVPAIERYVKALVHSSKFLGDLNQDEEKEVEVLKESLHLNLAMCYLKLKEWKKTRASCDSALEINTSVKGLYRRSQAFYYQRLFDEALRDCQAAVAMDTKNNKGIAAFLVTVQKQVDEQSKKEKAFYGKMFG